MFSIKPSKKLLACLVGIAFLLILTCGLVYKNRAARLHQLELQVREKEEKLANSAKIARQLASVEAKYFDAEAKLGILEQGVSTKAYVPTLLRQIEDLGKKVGLRVVGVRPRPQIAATTSAPSTAESDKKKEQKPKKPEPYEKLDIDIELDGKYWNVVRFLEEITYFPKIITVNGIQITPETQPMKTSQPDLTVRLSTTAFILKDSDRMPRRTNQTRACADMRTTGGGEVL